MEERRLSTEGLSLYRVLGVARTAPFEEVRRGYRRQALLYHPDKNPGNPTAAERFRELSHAYAVLSDPRSRKVYDRYGSQGVQMWQDVQHGQVNLLRAIPWWGKCALLCCGVLTCCYCCCCCCCCCDCCCGRCLPVQDTVVVVETSPDQTPITRPPSPAQQPPVIIVATV